MKEMPDTGDVGTQDRTSPSWSLGCLTLLLAVLIVVAMIFFFTRLRNYRPPVMLTATARNLIGLQDVTLTGNGAAQQEVHWGLSGSVRKLAFGGLGTAVVILPLPPRDCAKMAGALGGTCAGHRVRLSTPAAITWSHADPLNGLPRRQTTASLEVAPTRAGYVNLFARGSAPMTLCFNPPGAKATLWVTRGRSRFPAPVPGYQTTACGAGLAVVIGAPGGQNSPLAEVSSISSLSVTASAPDTQTQGFTGSIVLDPGGTTIIGSPAQVSMRAAGGAALGTAISTGTGGQSLRVRSGAAGSVITSAGEHVPSEWARNNDVVVPLFAGAVTLAVAVLSGAAQELMAWVRGWRPLFRRLDRRLEDWVRGRRAAGGTTGTVGTAGAADTVGTVGTVGSATEAPAAASAAPSAADGAGTAPDAPAGTSTAPSASAGDETGGTP
jgi:hypothetical protein